MVNKVHVGMGKTKNRKSAIHIGTLRTLEQMTEKGEPMTEKQAEIVMAFARSNMNMHEAGRAMFMHPTSVLYNLNRVYEKTGKNPRNFFDLCYLVGIAAQMGGSK